MLYLPHQQHRRISITDIHSAGYSYKLSIKFSSMQKCFNFNNLVSTIRQCIVRNRVLQLKRVVQKRTPVRNIIKQDAQPEVVKRILIKYDIPKKIITTTKLLSQTTTLPLNVIVRDL